MDFDIDNFMEKINIVYSKSFNFNGQQLTLNDVQDWEDVKTYTKSSHFDRILRKNSKTNELYLYEFYEYGFEDEVIYTTYVLVKDELDADRLNKERDIRRSPYFRVMPDYEIVIQ
jgi:hypothetical protein